MNVRSRLVQSASLATVALALLVGCSSANQPKHSASSLASSAAPASPAPGVSPPESQAPLPVIASSDSDPAQNQGENLDRMNTNGMKLQINSAKRDSSGIVTLTWTVANRSDHELDVFSRFWDFTNDYYGNSVSNVQLVDQAKQVMYHPLIDTDTACYCSRGGGINEDLEADTEQFYTDMFKPDPGTTKVDVKVWGFKPAKNVPIT